MIVKEISKHELVEYRKPYIWEKSLVCRVSSMRVVAIGAALEVRESIVVGHVRKLAAVLNLCPRHYCANQL